jgi:hypothetical protein
MRSVHMSVTRSETSHPLVAILGRATYVPHQAVKGDPERSATANRVPLPLGLWHFSQLTASTGYA